MKEKTIRKVKKEKLKVLPPTIRKRKRYIRFKIISQEPVNYSDLEHAIWNTFLDFYGEHGTAKLDIWLVKNLYDENEQIGIIQCEHKATDEVIAGLGLLTRLGDNRIVAKILKVSGTIKGATK